MPSNWLYIDTNFPTFTGEESMDQKVTSIQNYMYMLVEQLRYTLQNLDATNMNKTAVKRFTEPIYGRIEDSEGKITELTIQAGELVSQMEDLDGNVSAIAQYVDSITLAVSNGETSSLIQLKAGETLIASQQIYMSGLVTFVGLENGTTTIDGACIKTGLIDAAFLNLKGAITFGDLSSSVQDDINDAYTMAEDAQAVAGEASDTVGRWTYRGSTYIDGAMIQTGTVMASYLLGGTVGLLDASERTIGGIDLAYTSSGDGISMWTDRGGIRIEAAGNIWMEANGGSETLALASGYISCGADTMPRWDDQNTLGRSGYRWSTIYAASSTIVTSDREQKDTIEYDLSAYEKLFDGLKPCSYHYKRGMSGRTHTGLIAQDVESLLAELGMDSTRFAAFIKSPRDEGGHDYALRYEEFIGLCIDQIQKLKKRVARLEAPALP